MTLAPIAFFAYKRPEHTLRSLEALSRCDLGNESRLVVFCDGPRHPQDNEPVRRVREIVRSQPWCGTVEVVEREKNIGLANSITSGVSELCRKFGKVIVLEDDLIVSPYFLRYMNDALELYKDEHRVMQISGFMFDVELKANTDAIFIPFTTSWGWATWQRAWERYDGNVSGYEVLKKDTRKRKLFNYGGNYDFYGMLKKQISGKIDSWGIVWYLTVFMNNGLVLAPTKTLVVNGGFDGSGTHCGKTIEQVRGDFAAIREYKFPENIRESDATGEIYKKVIGVDRCGVIGRITMIIKRVLN